MKQLSFPDSPGYTNNTTSKAAAEDIAPLAGTIKEQVLAALKEGPLASFELARIIGRSYRSVQPRTSELFAKKEIYDTGLRRTDPETDKDVIVWAVVPY